MPIKQGRLKKTGVPGIRQDGPNRFLVRIDWTDEKTGRRRKREAVAASLSEAVALREQCQSGGQASAKPSRTRFADYGERWIVSVRNRLAPSTQERYLTSVVHLSTREAFGDYWIDAIGVGDIRRWRDKSVGVFAPATVNSHLRVLRLVLEDAMGDKLIEANPARSVKALSEGRTRGKRGNSLYVDEFRRFLVAIEQLKPRTERRSRKAKEISRDLARLLVTLAWTGMRKGEALALHWTDYANGELFVQRSVWRRIGKVTKTDDPRRIAVVEPLAVALEEQRRWLLETQHPGLESGLIFPASPKHARAAAKKRGSDEVCWYRSPSVLDDPLARAIDVGGLRKARKSGLPELRRPSSYAPSSRPRLRGDGSCRPRWR
jgi:integrase